MPENGAFDRRDKPDNKPDNTGLWQKHLQALVAQALAAIAPAAPTPEPTSDAAAPPAPTELPVVVRPVELLPSYRYLWVGGWILACREH